MVDTAIDLRNDTLLGADIEVLTHRARDGVLPSRSEHGTAIASLLAGAGRERGASALLPGSHIIAVDAFFREGGGDDKTDAATLVGAIGALVERGVKIINLSLSGPSNSVLEDAVKAWREQGVMFIAAAGNGGPGAAPAYPAAYPGVIAVTAVDRDLRIYRRATRGKYLALAAPGVHIRTSSANGEAVASGTSYAVPFVTAAVAMVRGRHASLDPGGITERLERAALDLGPQGFDETFGWGLLQAQGLCAKPDLEPAQAIRKPFDFPPS